VRRGSAPAVVAVAIAVLASGAPARERGRAADDWQATLDRVARGVVVLRVSVPRAFDTQLPAFEMATGFVVDAERGLILTNRHVVQPGPAVSEAVFLDHEEVAVQPIYRDPVHDFGFYRYDPDEVRFMDVAAIPLAPEKAVVGTEIRVVGNDAGEKLSILAGTLARVDREAPRYSRSGYNDFNTFYLQAASATSGGSSGSPVVDIAGRAVGLNAGGSVRAASSYYLPLDRAVRALALLRRGDPLPRGTLQAVFLQRPYDELRRLGLRPETEAAVRRQRPEGTGMLSVEEIVPGGPADGRLQVGDVIVRANGSLVTSFLPLESLLDESVGRVVDLEVERGGEPVSVAMTVQDLAEITPEAYLEVGGAVLHPLSYQQARNHSVPAAGIYLASAGYMFSRANVPRGVVITALGGEPVADLDAFEARLASFPADAQIPLRYFELENPRTENVAVVTLDRRWFTMRHCRRDDATGAWPCTASPPSPPVARPAPATTTFPTTGERPARRLAPSLVMVDFDAPYRLDGIYGDHYRGTGLVVDAEKGLVLVDRETVPTALGDVRVTFAASVEVPGEVVYLHPTHDFAVVAYDPALLGETAIRSATFRSEGLDAGDAVWLVGLTPRDQLVARKTRVSRVEAPTLPLTKPPRFREANLELISVDDSITTVGGVLADGKGRVHALWASFAAQGPKGTSAFFAGLPADRLMPVIERLRASLPVGWRSLGVELETISIAEARSRGLPDPAARQLEAHDGARRRVLSVVRRTAGTAGGDRLREGDLLVAIDGRTVTSHAEVEHAAQAERVHLRIVRSGEEIGIEVPTTLLDGRGTDRCVRWAGALLQAPHRAVAAQRGIVPEGVYVSWFWYGSPANRFGLRPTRRIVAVDGTPTPDLDAFLAAVADRPDRGPLRLRTLHLDGKTEVITLKLDLAFWPTVELRRGEDGWERIPH
jgi:S1-C subfamily serine protease